MTERLDLSHGVVRFLGVVGSLILGVACMTMVAVRLADVAGRRRYGSEFGYEFSGIEYRLAGIVLGPLIGVAAGWVVARLWLRGDRRPLLWLAGGTAIAAIVIVAT